MVAKHTFSKCFCWEELCDLEEDVMDMAISVIPTMESGEFSGMVKVTVEYIPAED